MILARKVANVARAVERKAIKIYTDTERHDANNRMCAAIILADEAKYAGALVQWAKAFLARVAK